MTERQSLVSRVKALAEALEESEVSDLDLTENGLRVKIRRGLEPPQVVAAAPAPRPARARPNRSASNGTAAAPTPGVAVIAPLSGVFYASPSPTSAPFVRVGESVQAGQVVCIVEAMKVFNEIKAEVSGTVLAMVAENGQLVQKGDALIRVQPM